MEGTKHILDVLRQNPESDVSSYISTYQLRATLLDTIIPESLHLLTSSYLAQQGRAQLRTIYVFCRVRGYKTILQNFPTDAHLLIALRDNLVRLNDDDWECHYTLLLWLAAVTLTPFELDLLEPGLFETLYAIASRFLCRSGVQRDAASLLMARLLTRSESKVQALTNRFVNEFKTPNESTSFASIAKLQVLAAVMDRVSTVPPSVRALVEDAEFHATEEDDFKPWYFDSALTVRLWVKILGRAALKDPDAYVEFAVSEFFRLFDDKSSQARLAAAKYIARAAKILGLEAREEILNGIFESLETDDVRYASPDYWNGALIALAELLRQSFFVSEATIERLVSNILAIKGLHFIQPTLRNNIGANVRDAACYVCWSLFRNREAQLTRELRVALYASLVALACLDNEVNVRRAAAAALQEGLGRYGASAGDMPAAEMFDLIDTINIHSVTLIKTCYEEIAPHVCTWPHFLRFFAAHGINSANPDIRRLAAHAAPLLPGCSNAIIDSLLDYLYMSEQNLSLHGKLLTLGVLCTKLGSSIYRAQELRALLNVDLAAESELAAEGMLLLASIDTSFAVPILQGLATDEMHVVKAAEDLMMHLSQDQLINEVVPLCSTRMQESRLFVSCFVQVYQRLHSETPHLKALLLRATRLPDPQSRALAVKYIGNTSAEFIDTLSSALSDYSVDERGDVGAWVREAAIERVVELSRSNTKWITDKIQSQLWHMASESRQKIRLKSSSALFQLGFISQELDTSKSDQFYLSLLQQCPLDKRAIVAAGLASSVGAARASLATIDGSLAGLLAFLDEGQQRYWILSEIMQLERKSAARIFEVVRTLRRVIITGFELPEELAIRCLAIVYNTTLNVGISEQIVMDAIDTLQVFAMQGRVQARERLLGLLKRHPNGRVRQRAADALFELGIESDILETTDWTRRDFARNAAKASI